MPEYEYLTIDGWTEKVHVDEPSLEEILGKVGGHVVIADSFQKAYTMLDTHSFPVCSCSGGSDSDIMVDILTKLDPDRRIRYIWFNTGLELKATKEHLNYLEQKYKIKIERLPAKMTVPTCCRKYGQPFISKFVSSFIEGLQKMDFQWEDLPYIELCKKYKQGGNSTYFKWWCNLSKYRSHCINYNKWLKEFMMKFPPEFPISNKCCTYAKKGPSQDFEKHNGPGTDLKIMGLRKFEGGKRASLESCVQESENITHYRPIYWYTNEDKRIYEELFNVKHSDAYEVYGFTRTGCSGCPYNRHLETDLAILEKYEPGLYQAANVIFAESYAYTRRYREFYQLMNEKEKREKVNGMGFKTDNQQV